MENFLFLHMIKCAVLEKKKLETVTVKLSVYNAILSATLLEKSQCFSNYGSKQPPEVFNKKRCSEKFHKIHRKTPVPESLF